LLWNIEIKGLREERRVNIKDGLIRWGRTFKGVTDFNWAERGSISSSNIFVGWQAVWPTTILELAEYRWHHRRQLASA